MNLGRAKIVDRLLGSVLGTALGMVDGARDIIRTPPLVQRVDHILVTKFWGVGNWALLRPIVHDLRARWPGARLTIATLATNAPLVDDLAEQRLLVRPQTLVTVARDLAGAVARLRRTPPDLAVDFEQFSRAGGLLARLGGARQRVGFASASRGRDRLYTVRVPFRLDVHVSRSFRDLAESAGVPHAPYVPGGLSVQSSARASLRRRWGPGRYVVLHPGSGDNFPGRRWSEAGFAAVGRAARDAGRSVFVSGGAAEVGLAGRVATAIGSGALSVAGQLSIPELVALIDAAEVLVANDTGPVHLASALETPTLALFGPNTPRLYGPLAPRSLAFYRDLPCSPCLTTQNYRSSRCRIHTCMASITTGEVVHALRRLMTAPPTNARAARGADGGEEVGS